MESSLLIALSRQSTLRREMTSVANNIANMNTHAYKGEKMMFDDYVARSQNQERLLGDKLAFVRDIAQVRDLSEGNIEETGNPLDLAIHGDGYFMIEAEAGERYTRNGHFSLNNEGTVTTSDGFPVLTADGAQIQIPPGTSRIEISRNGTINTNNGPIGQLGIVRFENEQKLEKTSSTLFSAEDPAIPVETPHILQGKLEGSNIQPIIEMTRMIQVHRSYDQAKSLIQKEDERIKKAVNLVRDR